ncbi:MAG: helix-turn-helix domain-containing protein [Lachnospirales bacterium]
MNTELNSIIKYFLDNQIDLEDIGKYSIKENRFVENIFTSNSVGIIIPIKGSALYRIDKVEYNMSLGKILFAAPNLTLDKYVRDKNIWEYYIIHFNSKKKNDFFIDNFVLEISPSKITKAFNIIEEIILLDNSQEFISKLKVKYKLIELICYFIENTKWHYLSNDLIVDTSIDFIKENMKEDIKINDLAILHNLDNNKFSYIFKNKTGINPKQFIIKIKLERAKQLLATSTLQINEIGKEVGYEDPFVFSKIFKKYEGSSPYEFKIMKTKYSFSTKN